MSSVPHFAVFIGANSLFTRAQLLLYSCHDNKLLSFTELGNIIVVIVTNPKFILPLVHEKFTVKFTMSNVDGYTIYMHIGCLNCPEGTSCCTRMPMTQHIYEEHPQLLLLVALVDLVVNWSTCLWIVYGPCHSACNQFVDDGSSTSTCSPIEKLLSRVCLSYHVFCFL